MLHYEMYTPPIQIVAQKERVMDRLLTKAPNYRKGNADETAKIAQEYPRRPVYESGAAYF